MEMHTTPRQWLGALVFLIISAVLLTVLVQGVNLAAAALGDSSAVTGTVSHDYAGWGYRANQLAGGWVDVQIYADTNSVSALHAFAAANRDLAKQLATQGGQASVHIVFRSYMDPARFRSWVKTTGIQVEDSAVAPVDGKHGSGGIPAKGADVLPQASIDEILADDARLMPDGPGTPPLAIGVYETRAIIAAQALPALSSDPLVFVADVTPAVVQRDLRAAGMFVPDQRAFDEVSVSGPMLTFGLAHQ